MVRQGSWVGNPTGRPRFRPTPWTVRSQEWRRIDAALPEEHLARLVDQCVDSYLDLSCFLRDDGRRGSPGYPPELLLKAVLYEQLRGHTSPATWHKDATETDPMKWLLFGANLSRRRWYAFRERIAPHLDLWNAQVLEFCRSEGFTDASEASLDGSFVAANASRHRMLNQERLRVRREELQQAVSYDADGMPVERPGQWMAPTATGRLQQLDRYQLAEKQMETLQQKNQRRRSDKRKEADKILVNPTDPKAVFGRDKQKVFRPLYNIQIFNDLKTPLVLAYDVFAQPSDSGPLAPMVERFVMLDRFKPKTILADAGYAEPADLEFCHLAGINLIAPWQENSFTRQKAARSESRPQISKDKFDWNSELRLYQCPEGHALQFEMKSTKQKSNGDSIRVEIHRCDSRHCMACPRQAQCTTVPHKGRTVRRHVHQDLIDAHRAKVEDPEVKARYKQRGCTVERIFADFKQHRGLRCVSGRGLTRAKTETAIAVLAHNLRTAHTLAHRKNAASQPCKTLKAPA